MINFILNDYGQTGVFYKGVNPPASGDLIWHEVDAQGNHVAWKEEIAPGNWQKINNTVILNVLNSFSTTAGLSANQGRILFGLITDNTDDIDTLSQSLANYQLLSQKNQPNGYPGLNQFGFIDPNQIDIDGFVPQGKWDASSGNPPSLAPQVGWIWNIVAGGNTLLNGIDDWEVGDHIYWSVNGWEKRPKADFNVYNDMDQTDPGFVLDARLGPIIQDAIDTLIQDVNNNASAINALTNLVAALQAANTALTNSLATKQDIIKRLPPGQVQNQRFTHQDLTGTQYGQLEVFVNGVNYHVPGFFSKVQGDDFITIPGEGDGAHVSVKIYPI